MAGRFSVEAVFKAVDRVTAPMSRMQNRVGKFTRSVTRGLRKANKAVDKMVRGMGRGIKTVAKFGGAAIGLGSAATIAAFDKAAGAADALAKQARRLKFPIGELQEWKFVAEQSGVSNELLDNSLGAFSKRLGEAAGGAGPLVSGLKKINPELLEQLKAADNISDAFGLYIDAMREADTATERAALANAAFSRSGLKLANIADNSAGAIDSLRGEQRRNGNITMEQAVAAEAYGDAVNALKRSLTGLVQQILLPMAPAITKNLAKWREWILANKELIKTNVTEFAKDLWGRIKALTVAAQEFSSKYNLAENIGKGLDTLGRFAQFLERNGSLIIKMGVAVAGLFAVLKTLTVVMAAVNLVMALNPIGLVVIAIAALVAGIVALVQYFGGFEKLAGDAMEAWQPVGQFFKDIWADVMESFGTAWDFIGSIVDKVKGAIDFVGGAVNKVKGLVGDNVDAATDAVSDAASGVAGFLGFGGGDDDDAGAAGQPTPAAQMVSPQERTARSVEESRSTSTSEVTIKDETGRAEVSGGRMGPGIKLQPSGAF